MMKSFAIFILALLTTFSWVAEAQNIENDDLYFNSQDRSVINNLFKSKKKKKANEDVLRIGETSSRSERRPSYLDEDVQDEDNYFYSRQLRTFSNAGFGGGYMGCYDPFPNSFNSWNDPWFGPNFYGPTMGVTYNTGWGGSVTTFYDPWFGPVGNTWYGPAVGNGWYGNNWYGNNWNGPNYYTPVPTNGFNNNPYVNNNGWFSSNSSNDKSGSNNSSNTVYGKPNKYTSTNTVNNNAGNFSNSSSSNSTKSNNSNSDYYYNDSNNSSTSYPQSQKQKYNSWNSNNSTQYKSNNYSGGSNYSSKSNSSSNYSSSPKSNNTSTSKPKRYR